MEHFRTVNEELYKVIIFLQYVIKIILHVRLKIVFSDYEYKECNEQ